MTAIDVDSDDDIVILAVPFAGGEAYLTPRQAFEVVTELLRHIERARACAAAHRRKSA